MSQLLQIEIIKYLHQCKQATCLIADLTQDKTFADYESDILLSAAVECEFEVMGAALNRLAKRNANMAKSISDSQQIIDIRKMLIHGGDAVDHQLIWDVAASKLPQLLKEVETLLKSR